MSYDALMDFQNFRNNKLHPNDRTGKEKIHVVLVALRRWPTWRISPARTSIITSIIIIASNPVVSDMAI